MDYVVAIIIIFKYVLKRLISFMLLLDRQPKLLYCFREEEKEEKNGKLKTHTQTDIK